MDYQARCMTCSNGTLYPDGRVRCDVEKEIREVEKEEQRKLGTQLAMIPEESKMPKYMTGGCGKRLPGFAKRYIVAAVVTAPLKSRRKKND